MKTYLIAILLGCTALSVFSQAPESISYQAVVRNVDGSVLQNGNASFIFSIKKSNPQGEVVYQERQDALTNAQGHFSAEIGNGFEQTGTLENIAWGDDSYFLQIQRNVTGQWIEMGSQQMMSAPYALYANQIHSRVSPTGDTLYVGKTHVIVPGISAANAPAPVLGCTELNACNFNPTATQDDGSCVITGATCDDNNANTVNDVINVQCTCAGNALINGLYYEGNGVTDIDGNTYNTIVINGQEWMGKNLAVSKYRNGDPITTGLSNTNWASTTSGAYAIYGDLAANNSTYGKLYNWYAMTDSRGVCPTGWHVPSEPEWFVLENYLGGIFDAGGKMKSTTGWTTPNLAATNVSGFTGLPGGYRLVNGTYNHLLGYGYFWTTTAYDLDPNYTWYHALKFDDSIMFRSQFLKRAGMSIRCLKD